MKRICLLIVAFVICCGCDFCVDMNGEYTCWDEHIQLDVIQLGSADSTHVLLYLSDSLIYEETETYKSSTHFYISTDLYQKEFLDTNLVLKVGYRCNLHWVWSDDIQFKTKKDVVNDISINEKSNGYPDRNDIPFSDSAIAICPELQIVYFHTNKRKPNADRCKENEIPYDYMLKATSNEPQETAN